MNNTITPNGYFIVDAFPQERQRSILIRNRMIFLSEMGDDGIPCQGWKDSDDRIEENFDHLLDIDHVAWPKHCRA